MWRLLVVKAGSDHNDLYRDPVVGQSYAGTGQGGGAWSHVILCERPAPEPDPLTLTVLKAWDGDDQGDAVATILLDGTELTDPVDVEDGDVVTITEQVTDLPDNCSYTSDPATPYEYTVDADDAVDGLITLTLTNTVDCEEDPGEEPPGEEPLGEEQEPTEVLGVVLDDADDTQVLGVQQTATSTELPRTGAGLLALLAFGLGSMTLGGALLHRRALTSGHRGTVNVRRPIARPRSPTAARRAGALRTRRQRSVTGRRASGPDFPETDDSPMLSDRKWLPTTERARYFTLQRLDHKELLQVGTGAPANRDASILGRTYGRQRGT